MDLKHDPVRGAASRKEDGPPRGPCVAILLSTFNGERYLDEQLRGYTAQTHADWLLYWRDDGSSDGGAALVEAFANGPGAGRCVRHPEQGRLHATGSFLALLHAALAGPAALFAFSDQDDVWLPDKLAHGAAALRAVPEGQAALYFCARMLVDKSLRPLGPVAVPRPPPGFPGALTQNLIPGCCMILNRAAAERIDAIAAPADTWHDWWSYLVVAAHEGRIIAGSTPDILYRQHDRNLVGERRGSWRRALAALRRGRVPFMHRFWRHTAALQARAEQLPERTRARLALLDQASHGGVLTRVRALRHLGLARRTWLETLLFRLWFVLENGPGADRETAPDAARVPETGVPKSFS